MTLGRRAFMLGCGAAAVASQLPVVAQSAPTVDDLCALIDSLPVPSDPHPFGFWSITRYTDDGRYQVWRVIPSKLLCGLQVSFGSWDDAPTVLSDPHAVVLLMHEDRSPITQQTDP